MNHPPLVICALLILFVTLSCLFDIGYAGVLVDGPDDRAGPQAKGSAGRQDTTLSYYTINSCPPPRCDDDCPIPAWLIENQGQLCPSLLAHFLGDNYCTLVVNQEQLVYFKRLRLSSATQGKKSEAFGITQSNELARLEKEIRESWWLHRWTYFCEYYFTTLVFLCTTLLIVRKIAKWFLSQVRTLTTRNGQTGGVGKKRLE